MDLMRKTLWVLPGYCVGLGGLALITYRTLLAVSSESKSVILQVNRFGEQYVDLVCLVFLWVVCVIGLLSLSSAVREKTSRREGHDKRHEESVAKEPAVVLAGVPQSFMGRWSVRIVEGFEVPVVTTGSGFSSVDEHGTNGAFSFSVRLVQESTEEENG
jgi:hypothetical protein